MPSDVESFERSARETRSKEFGRVRDASTPLTGVHHTRSTRNVWRRFDRYVISRLAATEGVSDAEAAELSVMLLFAGHETTVFQIGIGALHLLTNPEQWQALRNDPGLLPNAVEEILRAPTRSGGAIPRYARTDVDADDVTIRAGDLVLLEFGAANHDDAVFADPDRFDLTRSGAQHLSFGYGARYCIGALLARIELQAVFAQLARQLPGLRPAVDIDELTMHRNVLIGGLTALPVQW
jgi:pentalenolactone synthase